MSTLFFDDRDTSYSEEERQRAMDQAFRFLNQRFLSSYELRQKMKRKGFSMELIEYIESRLMELDYINDDRLSNQVVTYLMEEKKYGSYVIKQKMKLRGLIVPPIIDTYDELAAAFRVVDKKYGSHIHDIPVKKIYQFLTYRGFSHHTISQVCSEYNVQ